MQNLFLIVKNKVFYIFLGALVLRLFFVFSAYHGDLNNNISWGGIAYQNGLDGFYGSSDADDWPFSAPNQPPLTILLFAATAFLWNFLDNTFHLLNESLKVFPSSTIWFWQERGMTLLVKLPSLIADLGIGALIYKYIQKKQNTKNAFIILCIWLFNPVVLYNSTVWGQTDSIVNFLGLVAIFALFEKKLVKFSVFFMLSILFKGSLIVFVPVLLFVVLRQKYSFIQILHATFYMLLTTVLVSVWFFPHINFPLWFINLYKERILPGEIGYLTANAFNFWWLVDSGKTYDSVIYYGLSARVWSLVVAVLGNIFLVAHLLKGKFSENKLFFTLAIASMISFLFLTRIHERYLYPFFPYITLVLFEVPGVLVGYIILSLVYFANLYNLFWLPDIPLLVGVLKETNFPTFLALTNIILFGYFLYLYVRLKGESPQKEKKLRRQ